MIVPPVGGFAGDSPGHHLTERQLVWVAYRLSSGDDLEACVQAKVEPEEVLTWRSDPGFGDALVRWMGDKRGGFRPITENLLPLAVRTIYDMLANGDPKYKEKALAHLIRAQGLFVDTVRHEDPEAVESLLRKLREYHPVQILDVKPRA